MAREAAPPAILRAAVEWVPALARHLARVLSGRRHPAPEILRLRDRLEVVGIHAAAVSAEMIELEVLRDRAAERGERETVRVNDLVPANVEAAIAAEAVTGPIPASRVVIDVDLREKTIRKRAQSPFYSVRIRDAATGNA
jgi:hypothetical protein